MRLATSEGPRRCGRIVGVLGLCAMALPWIFPLRAVAGAILFDAGSIAELLGLLLLLGDLGGPT